MLEMLKYLATTEAEGGQPTENIEVEPQQSTEQVAQVETPTTYDIDGESYSIDDIREWRKSGLRQSDYTKKTQELSKQRKEAQEALEVYNYLMGKPHLLQKLSELDEEGMKDINEVKGKLDPVQKEIQDLKTQLKIKDIDAELDAITKKDKSVNDVELLEIATNHKCDINTAYNIWRGNNFDKIMQDKEKTLRAKITEEIQKNQGITKTLMNPTDATPEVKTYGLTDRELAMAERLGMSVEEYSKYKNPNYKW